MKNTSGKESLIKRINLVPRLLCLAVAFVIWIYVMEVDSPDYEVTFDNVPVTLVGTSQLEEQGLSVFSGSDGVIDVTVRGQKSVISRYTKNDIIINADVSGVTESGRSAFDLFFDLPEGLSLVSRSESSINLFIDRRTTVDVAVTPKLSAYKITTDYELGQLSCDVSTISVTGPASVLSDISYASVDVSFGDNYIDKSWTTDGNVILMNTSDEPIESRYLRLSQNSVRVSVPVFTYRDVALKASYKYGFFENDGTDVSFEPKNIRIKGEPANIENLDSIAVTTLDEKSIVRDTSYLVDIVLPDGVSFADGEPNTATVSVKRNGMTRRAISVKNITVDSDKDTKYEVLTNSVSVTIIAKDDEIINIDADDIVLNADITNLKSSSGIFLVPVEVRINYKGGIAYELGEYNIQVSVKND